MSPIEHLKIAIVHDQLADFGGAERVLIALKDAFPQADVYTSFVDTHALGSHATTFASWRIVQSWARHIPGISTLYSPLRFLLPLIWKSFDLSSYDAVICSSAWGMSKGVSLKKYQQSGAKKPVFFCYLHTPPRHLYGYDESALRKYLLVRIYALIVNHFLRQYDYLSSQSVDHFIFNAQEVQKRSLKFYRRDGTVIHPPIASGTASYNAVPRKDYYLTVSRLVSTKHIDVLIDAANTKGFHLKIVGVGKEFASLQAIAGKTVELLGAVSDEKRNSLYAEAKAFLYASKNEDFGMVPVEAMAHGTPVIAYASGGVLETVQPGVNGFLYHDLQATSVASSIASLEALSTEEYEAMCLRAYTYAQEFSHQKFVERVRAHVCAVLSG